MAREGSDCTNWLECSGFDHLAHTQDRHGTHTGHRGQRQRHRLRYIGATEPSSASGGGGPWEPALPSGTVLRRQKHSDTFSERSMRLESGKILLNAAATLVCIVCHRAKAHLFRAMTVHYPTFVSINYAWIRKHSPTGFSDAIGDQLDKESGARRERVANRAADDDVT